MAIDDLARKRTDESYNRLFKKRYYNKVLSLVSLIFVSIGFLILIIPIKSFLNPNPEDRKPQVNSNLGAKESKKIDSLYKMDSLQTIKIRTLSQILAKPPDANVVSFKSTASRLNYLENKIKQDSSQIFDLRSSINPEKPEEILRLARLNDKLDQLKLDINSLKENLKSEENQFELSINNQMSNSRTFYIALITILVPITVRFIMQSFKDFYKE